MGIFGSLRKKMRFRGSRRYLKNVLIVLIVQYYPFAVFRFLSLKNSTFLRQAGKSNILSTSIFAHINLSVGFNLCDLVYSIYQVHFMYYIKLPSLYPCLTTPTTPSAHHLSIQLSSREEYPSIWLERSSVRCVQPQSPNL